MRIIVFVFFMISISTNVHSATAVYSKTGDYLKGHQNARDYVIAVSDDKPIAKVLLRRLTMDDAERIYCFVLSGHRALTPQHYAIFSYRDRMFRMLGHLEERGYSWPKECEVGASDVSAVCSLMQAQSWNYFWNGSSREGYRRYTRVFLDRFDIYFSVIDKYIRDENINLSVSIERCERDVVEWGISYVTQLLFYKWGYGENHAEEAVYVLNRWLDYLSSNGVKIKKQYVSDALDNLVGKLGQGHNVVIEALVLTLDERL